MAKKKRVKCARGRYKTGPKKGDCVCAHGLVKSGKRCRKTSRPGAAKFLVKGKPTFGGYHRAAGGKLRLRRKRR